MMKTKTKRLKTKKRKGKNELKKKKKRRRRKGRGKSTTKKDAVWGRVSSEKNVLYMCASQRGNICLRGIKVSTGNSEEHCYRQTVYLTSLQCSQKKNKVRPGRNTPCDFYWQVTGGQLQTPNMRNWQHIMTWVFALKRSKDRRTGIKLTNGWM